MNFRNIIVAAIAILSVHLAQAVPRNWLELVAFGMCLMYGSTVAKPELNTVMAAHL